MTTIPTVYRVVLHLIVLVLLFVLVFKSDFLERVTFRYAKKPPSELSSRFYERLAFHKDTIDTVPSGSVLFIGDSITHQLFVEDVTDKGVNYGIGGDTTVGVLSRIGTYAKRIKEASAVILAIGTNDINRRSDGEILVNFSLILDQITDTPVFVSSILPVDELANGVPGRNKRTSLINDSIELMASQRNNVTYVSNTTAFDQDSDGQLDVALHRGDGLHLSDDGLKIWATSLRTALAAEPVMKR